MFRFYSNQLSQATRKIATVAFIAGMMLIGFGILIMALPELFALLAAIFFFIAGIGVMSYAVRIFCAASKISKQEDVFRHNVKIHDPFKDHQE